MRRNWRSNRSVLLIMSLFLCSGLILFSSLGILGPVEGVAAAPLNIVTGLFNDLTLTLNRVAGDTNDIDELKARNAELEEQLAIVTAELIELREIASDIDRLSGLLEYTRASENQTYVTAEVIGRDQQSSIRSIFINRGTRDGLAVGMPVVTSMGLVGRVSDVSANFARVQLITDQNSFVSARLQTSRAEGTVNGRGLETGSLEMLHIPVDREIQRGELVVTSGLGGNFPPDIVIGQVTSFRDFEFELTQTAQVNSLIDFNTLEFVLVVTSFEPADLSIFDEPE